MAPRGAAVFRRHAEHFAAGGPTAARVRRGNGMHENGMIAGTEVLTSGPPRYVPETPWGVLTALAATAVVVAAQLLPAVASLALADPADVDSAVIELFSLASPVGVAVAAGGQLLSLILVWLFAGRGGQRAAVLRLTAERFTWALYAAAAAAVIVATGLLELLLVKTFALDIFEDSKWLIEGVHSPLAWGTLVIAIVLAPLWEEFTFRGFLLSALAKSPLGFWGGALVSNILWTALHAYSWAGVASVFLAGLVLSWLVWRTGSIKPAIVAHAVGNLFAVSVIYAFAPGPVPVPV